MLERIGTPGNGALSKPKLVVCKYLDMVTTTNPAPVYFEIGVGIGATALSVAERLDNRGTIYLFSRATDVQDLSNDLRLRGYQNINDEWGSPPHTYSGYHFELARGAVSGRLPTYDLAFLDGGHVYHLDAPAACVLKELCKPGGYLILDDWSWSLEKSPSMNPTRNPATARHYDPVQIAEFHIQLVCKTVMDTDPRFEFIGLETDCAIYRRKA